MRQLSLAIYFTQGSDICQCYSLTSFQPPLPLLCPQVHSLCLSLYSSPVTTFISTIFLDSIYIEYAALPHKEGPSQASYWELSFLSSSFHHCCCVGSSSSPSCVLRSKKPSNRLNAVIRVFHYRRVRATRPTIDIKPGFFAVCSPPLRFSMGLKLRGSLKDVLPFQWTVPPQTIFSLHPISLTSPSAHHFCGRDNTVCSSNTFISFLDFDG